MVHCSDISCDLEICEPWVQFLVVHIFSAHNHRMESVQTLLGLRTDSALTVYVSKHNLNHDYAHSIQNSSDSVRTGLEYVGESKDLQLCYTIVYQKSVHAVLKILDK